MERCISCYLYFCRNRYNCNPSSVASYLVASYKAKYEAALKKEQERDEIIRTYKEEGRAKEIKKNQKIVVVKELRVTPVIGDNDFETKIKNCREFLAAGHKVKITLYYPRGKRRLLQMESSSKILDKFVEALDDVAAVDSTTVVEGRTTAIQLSAKKIKK